MSSNYDYSHINNYDELKKLQGVLLEMLEMIDLFCKKNAIGYSLCGGCMIGAVRHGGFIPWDDDVDIIMKRTDYDRFIQLWHQNPPSGYVLQNKDTEGTDIDITFCKVRKKHTTFLQFEEEREKYHVGIFLDIFPFDRIPNNRIHKYFFYWHCMKYQLYSREYVPNNTNFLICFFSKILLLMSDKTKRKKKREKLLKKITMYNSDTSLPLVAVETIRSMKISYSANLMDELIPIRFENKEFLCFKNWKEYLSKFYGDYMTLPPKEQQNWYHHPIILDFEHDYDGLID